MSEIIIDSADLQDFITSKRFPDEKVVFSIGATRSKGILEAINGTLIATTKRVVFYSKGGFFSRGVEESLAYPQITNMSFEAPGPLGGRGFIISVATAGRSQTYHCITGWGFDDGGKSMMGKYRNCLMKYHELATRPAAAAAPAKTDPMDTGERLRRLNELHEEGLISDEEFEAKRKDILNSL